jgi:hypothetical protein
MPKPLAIALTSLALFVTACATDVDVEIDVDEDPEPNPEVEDGELLDEPGQASLGPEVPESIAAACAVTVSKPSELMITNVAVVEDPIRTQWTGALTSANDGAWHFGRLMTEMAGANDPAVFVRTWLSQWAAARTVNGQTVPARAQIASVIRAWPKTAAGTLDLRKAPMRLLAIVHRVDLRSPGNAGEGRFVFGVLGANGNPMQFTIILEYKLPAADAAAVTQWANDWHSLGALPLGSATYRSRLAAITRKFTRRGAFTGRPNDSAISQVRTNEIALAFPWELREFRLTTTGQLRMAAPALTPANNLDNSATLAAFMTAIKAQTHTVPLSFQSKPFQAASVTNNIDFWNAPGITDSTLRQRFSINTCNGCHGAESSTSFLDVFPRNPGQEAQLSGFLSGVDVVDPVTGSTTRRFADLNRRANGLKAFLCAP